MFICGKVWFGSRHFVKMKPMAFADRLDVDYVTENVTDNSVVLDLSNWKGGIAVH